jgi:hypothetical protein
VIKISNEPDAYAFKLKRTGYITISRHKKPDFVAGLTDEEIKEKWFVTEVFFK